MTDSDFRSAFYAHKDVLYRFVYRMTASADDAEEIVQECFLALWRKPEAYDPNRGTLRAFLFGIARKLVLKRWRDQHPHDSLEEDSSTCGPVDLLGQERGQMVARAVQTLPPLQREAIILAEYEELDVGRNRPRHSIGAWQREVTAAPGTHKSAADARSAT